MPKDSRQWVLPGVFSAALLIAAFSGLLPHLVTMLLLPVMLAVLAYTAGTVPTILTAAVGAAGCFAAGLSGLWVVAVPWSVLNCFAALCPLKDQKKRVWLWAGVIVIAWAAYLILLQVATEGQMVTGMIRELREQLAQSPYCDTLLINAYSSGFARVSDAESLGQLYVSSMMQRTLPEAVKNELLNSLQLTMEEMMPGSLCEVFIAHVTLQALLCTLIPDLLRSRNEDKTVFPKFTEWHMPSGIGLAVGVLAIGWLIQLMTESDLWLYIGIMTGSVFAICYGLQGISFQLWLEAKMGMGKVARALWIIGMLLLIPYVTVILGIVDQRRDARNLRNREETV